MFALDFSVGRGLADRAPAGGGFLEDAAAPGGAEGSSTP
jgi:hypothetical protein